MSDTTVRKLACPGCKTAYNISKLKVGTRFKCSHCATILTVTEAPVPVVSAVAAAASIALSPARGEESALITRLKNQIRQEQENSQKLLDEILAVKDLLRQNQDTLSLEEGTSSDLRDRVEHLSADLSAREQELSLRAEKIARHESQIESLTGLNAHLRQTEEAQGKNLQELRLRLDDLLKELAKKEEAIGKGIDEMARQSAEIEKISATSEVLKNTVDCQGGQIQELQKSEAILRQEVDFRREEITKNTAEIQTLSTQNKDLRKGLEEQSKTLQETTAREAKLLQDAEYRKEEYQKAIIENGALLEQNQQLKKTSESQAGQLQELRNREAVLQQEVAYRREELKKRGAEVEELSNLNREIRQVTEDQGRTIQDLRKREAELTLETTEKRDRILRLEKTAKEKGEEIAHQTEEIGTLRETLGHRDRTILELRQSEDKLSKKIVELNAGMARQDSVISGKNNEILDLNTQLERSHEKSAEMKEKAEGYLRTVKALKLKLQEMNEVLRDNQKDSDKKDLKIAELVKAIERARAETKREKDKNQVRLMVQALIARREELNAQIEQLMAIQQGENSPEALKKGELAAAPAKREALVEKIENVEKATQILAPKKPAPEVAADVQVAERIVSPFVQDKAPADPKAQGSEGPMRTAAMPAKRPMSRYPSPLDPTESQIMAIDAAFPAGMAVDLEGRIGKVLKDGLIQWEDGGIGNLRALKERLRPANANQPAR